MKFLGLEMAKITLHVLLAKNYYYCQQLDEEKKGICTEM